MEDLKKLIEANYCLDLFLDPYDRLHTEHNGLRIDIEKIGLKEQPYVSIHGDGIFDNFVCENDEVVLYSLLKYCKDAHRWGEFQTN